MQQYGTILGDPSSRLGKEGTLPWRGVALVGTDQDKGCCGVRHEQDSPGRGNRRPEKGMVGSPGTPLHHQASILSCKSMG